MTFLKTIALAGSLCLVVILGYMKITGNPPGYCGAQQRFVSDRELITRALRMREGEIADFGGIDEYEKHFIRLNRNPEEAGRDFDDKNPNCCDVYRGEDVVKKKCGMSYPTCVLLHFPPLKDVPIGHRYYKREGRTYFFDDCGKLQEQY